MQEHPAGRGVGGMRSRAGAMAASFHPELAGDNRIHQLFADVVDANSAGWRSARGPRRSFGTEYA